MFFDLLTHPETNSSHVGSNLFPYWEHIIPTLGTKRSLTGNILPALGKGVLEKYNLSGCQHPERFETKEKIQETDD